MRLDHAPGWHGVRISSRDSQPVTLGSSDDADVLRRPCGGTRCSRLPAGRTAGATSRIKDLANIEGVRQNQLIGYGLVVGLNGTGDTLNNIPFTKQSLQAMLERLGVNIRGATLRTGNVAAVMVTANLPAFVDPGHPHRRHRLGARRRQEPAGRHAAGHAAARRRRQGLCGRPGLGRDRRFPGRRRRRQDRARRADRRPHRQRRARSSARSNSTSIARASCACRCAIPTSPPPSASPPRSTTIIGVPTAESLDPGTVGITVPQQYRGNVISLLTEIEQLQVEPDLAAKIVIDERSGIIVMGRDVRVSMVAVAQGNLTVTITETPQVSQPDAVAPRGARPSSCRAPASACRKTARSSPWSSDGVSLQQLVDGLNALGIGPRDLIAILQAIKAAGAIQADIEVM